MRGHFYNLTLPNDLNPYRMQRIISLLALLICAQVYSQTITYPQPIHGFQISSEDLLNFSVLHSGNEAILVSYLIQVQHKDLGVVLEMESAVHKLSPGSNLYNQANVNIQRKQYLLSEFMSYELKTRSLPAGDYQYCVRVLCRDKEEDCISSLNPEMVQNRCADFIVKATTPLMLNFPRDKEVLEEKRPNFNWIPPMPIGNDPEVKYQFTLVKLNEGQSAEDAIRRNRPIYEREGISAINLTFPTTLEDLEEGKSYAWQVVAFYARIELASSDVWEFEIEKELTGVSFVNVQQQNIGVHSCNQTLYFIYESPLDNVLLDLILLDSKGNEIALSTQYTVSRGINKLVLERASFSGIIDETYSLRIIDPKNRKHILKFKFLQ